MFVFRFFLTAMVLFVFLFNDVYLPFVIFESLFINLLDITYSFINIYFETIS